jgi:hypothetical protein
MTNEQAQEVAALAVALHRTRRELQQAEATGAYRSARAPRVEAGRLELELAAKIDAVEQG